MEAHLEDVLLVLDVEAHGVELLVPFGPVRAALTDQLRAHLAAPDVLQQLFLQIRKQSGANDQPTMIPAQASTHTTWWYLGSALELGLQLVAQHVKEFVDVHLYACVDWLPVVVLVDDQQP
jgi:hypothetical protein